MKAHLLLGAFKACRQELTSIKSAPSQKTSANKVTGDRLKTVLMDILGNFEILINEALFFEAIKKENSKSLIMRIYNKTKITATITLRVPQIVSQLRSLDHVEYVPKIYSDEDCVFAVSFLSMLDELRKDDDLNSKRSTLMNTDSELHSSYRNLIRALCAILRIDLRKMLDIDAQRALLWERIKTYLDHLDIQYVRKIFNHIGASSFLRNWLRSNEEFLSYFRKNLELRPLRRRLQASPDNIAPEFTLKLTTPPPSPPPPPPPSSDDSPGFGNYVSLTPTSKHDPVENFWEGTSATFSGRLVLNHYRKHLYFQPILVNANELQCLEEKYFGKDGLLNKKGFQQDMYCHRLKSSAKVFFKEISLDNQQTLQRVIEEGLNLNLVRENVLLFQADLALCKTLNINESTPTRIC